MKTIKIAIPYPHHSSIGGFIDSQIEKLKAVKLPFDYIVEKGMTADIAKCRNGLINQKKSNLKKQKLSGFDYLLLLDSDIEFEPENLIKLFKLAEKNNYDVICGAYKVRYEEKLCAGYWDKWHGDPSKEKMLSINETGIKKVDWVSFGFGLIRRTALEKMIYPWFYRPIIERDDRVYCPGEEMGFSLNAGNNNINLYVDCDNIVIHRTELNTFQSEGKMQQQQQKQIPQQKQIQMSAEEFLYAQKRIIDTAINHVSDALLQARDVATENGKKIADLQKEVEELKKHDSVKVIDKKPEKKK